MKTDPTLRTLSLGREARDEGSSSRRLLNRLRISRVAMLAMEAGSAVNKTSYNVFIYKLTHF